MPPRTLSPMHNPDLLEEAAEWLREATRIVVFTGAGASAESGIPTFRDAVGLWTRFPPEQFANWKGLTRVAVSDPARLAEFLYVVFQPIAAAEPNPAHRAIARLETLVGQGGSAGRQAEQAVTVVTQNIDNLHQDAGSSRVIEVHGSLFEIVTHHGRPVGRVSREQMLAMVAAVERAKRGAFRLPRVLWAMRRIFGFDLGGIHRPSVVLFGDAMAEPAWTNAVEACRTCDLLIEVGTSGAVMPAALLPYEARSAGARVIAVDPQECPADIWLPGPAGRVLPALVDAAFPTG